MKRFVLGIGGLVPLVLMVMASTTPAFAQTTRPTASATGVLTLSEARAQIANRNSVAAPASVTCVGPVVITSTANGRFVSAELGYTGGNYAMLRARATAVGPWEQFTLCEDSQTGVDTLTSNANGRAVSAELGYTGGNYAMLRARATAIGPWEQFFVLPFGNNLVILSAANNRYVSAELGYTGGNYAMLRARATAIGPWEQFQ